MVPGFTAPPRASLSKAQQHQWMAVRLHQRRFSSNAAAPPSKPAGNETPVGAVARKQQEGRDGSWRRALFGGDDIVAESIVRDKLALERTFLGALTLLYVGFQLASSLGGKCVLASSPY